MAPSVSSTELLESGPARPPFRFRRWQLLVGLGLAVGAAGAAVAVHLSGPHPVEATPPVRYVETWIDAWNDRDSQALSSMTCDYIPAFTAANVFEIQLGAQPAGRPIVAEYTITGTQPGVAYGRTGVRVDLSYVPGGRESTHQKSVFVRVRDDGDMCIGYFPTW